MIILLWKYLINQFRDEQNNKFKLSSNICIFNHLLLIITWHLRYAYDQKWKASTLLIAGNYGMRWIYWKKFGNKSSVWTHNANRIDIFNRCRSGASNSGAICLSADNPTSVQIPQQIRKFQNTLALGTQRGQLVPYTAFSDVCGTQIAIA